MRADEIERLISLVQSPSGDSASLRIRERYFSELIAGGSEAQDHLVRTVESGDVRNAPVLLDVLAGFGTSRAAEVIAKKLEAGPEAISEAAADALAKHPTQFALEALHQSLYSSKSSVALAALIALRRYGQSAPCAILIPLLRSPDRSVRFQAIHLARKADCLSVEALADLQQREQDPEIGALIKTLYDDAPEGRQRQL